MDGAPRDVTRLNPTVAGAAGGVMSTTADLNTFFRALLGGRLLRPGELALMKTAGVGGGYGLGLELFTTSCGTAYGHGGGIPGYVTGSFHSADGGRQVTVSATPYRGDAVPALQAVLEKGLCG
ncbi:serine hydrolase [Nonomuraea sp. NPDC050547]|uniref:serine hydrolase n=1 Tax=Nonomuraea sp. NPDC050547 TaxID=3364368 RepID=UPI0037A5C0A3